MLWIWLAAGLWAQQAVRPQRAELREAESTLRTELSLHGERAMGDEVLHWSTRLEGISGCRVALSVRASSRWGESTVRRQTISFSLGALQPYGLTAEKSWLSLGCAGRMKCIDTSSFCTATTPDGMKTDCSTPSRKADEVLRLYYDGDAAAASRILQSLRKAIELCREPLPVTF